MKRITLPSGKEVELDDSDCICLFCGKKGHSFYSCPKDKKNNKCKIIKPIKKTMETCKHLTAKALLKNMGIGSEIQCGCGGIIKKTEKMKKQETKAEKKLKSLLEQMLKENPIFWNIPPMKIVDNYLPKLKRAFGAIAREASE